MSNSFIYPPGADPGNDNQFAPITLDVGSLVTISWSTTYQNITLKAWQGPWDGLWWFTTLLDNVPNPSTSTYEWLATRTNSDIPYAAPLHFQIYTSSDTGFNSKQIAIQLPGSSSSSISSASSTASSSVSSSSSSASSSESPTSTSASSTGSSSNTSAQTLTSTSTTATPSSQTSAPTTKISTVGLGVGLGLGIPLVLLLGVLLGVLWRRKRKTSTSSSKSLPAAGEAGGYGKPELSGNSVQSQNYHKYEVEGRQVHEIP